MQLRGIANPSMLPHRKQQSPGAPRGAAGRPVPASATRRRRHLQTAASAAAPGPQPRGPARRSAAAAPEAPAASLPPPPGPPAAADETLQLFLSPLKYGLDRRAQHQSDVFRAPVMVPGGVTMITSTKAITELLADDGHRWAGRGLARMHGGQELVTHGAPLAFHAPPQSPAHPHPHHAPIPNLHQPNSVAFHNSEAFSQLMNDGGPNAMTNVDQRMQQRRLMSPAFSNDALNA
jgi:hypothetical protein